MATDEHEGWWPADDVAAIRIHPEPPPDPRRVDPVKAGQLRDLFLDPGWSGDGADMAILRCLFCARITGRRIGVPSWGVSQDSDALRRGIGPKRHYVSTAFVSLPPYTTSLDAALRLLGSVLPHAGYAIVHRHGAAPEARLMDDRGSGVAHRGRSPALALLAGLFDQLSIRPATAEPRRQP